MKSLHLTNSWHQTSGGIATFYRNLIEAANRRRYQIRLVVPAERDDVEEVGEFGRIYHVQAPPSLLNSAYRTIYPQQFLQEGSRLQQILVAERPDLVEICDKYTLNYLGAVLRKGLLRAVDFRPVVVGLSCERMDDNFGSYLGSFPLSRTFCSAYMKWLYFPFFDYHIANSEYTAAELRAVATRQSGPRSGWIRHMGVDLAQLSPQRRSIAVRRRLLQRCGGSDDSILLLYVGRLVPEKNLGLLFQLLANLAQKGKRDFRLLIAGDGIERGRWEAECGERIPGRAWFLGHVKDRESLANLYANSDIFVHPNPREPFGIAPLEAMASGLPLVAPDRGGITSYANMKNAWTVPASLESFAAAVEEVVANQSLRAEKAGKALADVQSYRWETVTSSFLELYDQLHRTACGEIGVLPIPDFNSTVASGLRAAFVHVTSQLSARTFAATARFRLPSSLPATLCQRTINRSRPSK